MFGGRYPNIDRWAKTTGRYEGAKAEKAVPSPSVAHRSQFFGLLPCIGDRACAKQGIRMQGEDDD
jgi:hypothetical protein